jgi:hypothetical protein
MTTIDGFIYKISSTDNKMNYYGYTTKDIKTRLNQHIYYYIQYYTHKNDPDQIVNQNSIYNTYLTYYNSILIHIKNDIIFNKQTDDKAYCTSYDIFNFYKFDQIKIEIVEHMQNTTLDKIKNKEKYYIQHFHCVNKMGKQKIKSYYTLSDKFITLDELEKDIPILQNQDTHIHHIIHILGYQIDTHKHLKRIQKVSFYYIKEQLRNILQLYYPHIKVRQNTIADLLFKTNTILNTHHLEIVTYKTLTRKGTFSIVDCELLLLSYKTVSQAEAQIFLKKLFIQKQNNTY